MSTTLIIRHLCGKLDVSERVEFLKCHGAQKVWFIKESGHTAFASFVSREAAEAALRRLHQMRVLDRRLVVEYSEASAPIAIPAGGDGAQTARTFEKFLSRLNATNDLLNFTRPPPPDLRYKYPPASPSVLFNVMRSLRENVHLYTQTLHLMNKMCLDPPFGPVEDDTREFVAKCLVDVGIQTAESEASDESYVETPRPPTKIKPKKISKIKLNAKNKIKHNAPSAPRRRVDPTEAFEDLILSKRKKIDININPPQTPSFEDSADIVGTIGKLDPAPSEQIPAISKDDPTDDAEQTITIEDILSNRISSDDMKILSVFKNYNPGAPSLRLYIKNLSKGVTQKDVTDIYRHYVAEDSEEQTTFDVRVMQEGRMKGQAFVTFPTLEASQKALNETNGFIFKDKPMVVQFARTANK